MYRIAICDDEERYLEQICSFVQNFCERRNISVKIESYTDSDFLMERIESGCQFDAYLLDIQMKTRSGMEMGSGLEVAEHVKKYSGQAFFLYLTSFADYAVEACGVRVVKYILKEKIAEELETALEELFAHLAQIDQKKMYLIENQRKYVKLCQDDMIRIRREQKNVVFELKNGRMEKERSSLREVCKKLNDPAMVFFDKGNIISLKHIQTITKGEIIMDNGLVLKANDLRIAHMKKLVNIYLGSRPL